MKIKVRDIISEEHEYTVGTCDMCFGGVEQLSYPTLVLEAFNRTVNAPAEYFSYGDHWELFPYWYIRNLPAFAQAVDGIDWNKVEELELSDLRFQEPGEYDSVYAWEDIFGCTFWQILTDLFFFRATDSELEAVGITDIGSLLTEEGIQYRQELACDEE